MREAAVLREVAGAIRREAGALEAFDPLCQALVLAQRPDVMVGGSADAFREGLADKERFVRLALAPALHQGAGWMERKAGEWEEYHRKLHAGVADAPSPTVPSSFGTLLSGSIPPYHGYRNGAGGFTGLGPGCGPGDPQGQPAGAALREPRSG